MKTLKFKQCLVDQILRGEKTSTWRLFDDKDLNIGEKIEDIIKITVHNILNKSKNVEMPNDVVFTDNFGEILEKLIILTTRVWYLEDKIGELISINDPKYNQEIVNNLDKFAKRMLASYMLKDLNKLSIKVFLLD